MIRERIGADRAARVHVISTGVDVSGIRALTAVDPRAAEGWPSDALIVGSLGRLAPEKSPGVLFDAVALAAASVPSLRLLVVGGGPSEPDLRVRAALPDLAGRASLTGTLPRPEALTRIAGADLFCFTSQTETQGLVLAEALSAGLPAVAVDGPGVRDSVRDGVDGVIVSADPADSLVPRLAAAVAELAADQARRSAMGERARSDADRFAVERRVSEIEALYREVGGGGA